MSQPWILPHQWVALRDRATGAILASTFAGPAGTWLLTVLPEGTYDIVVEDTRAWIPVEQPAPAGERAGDGDPD